MATADVPLTWSDTSNVQWKVEIPGRGHSTPVAAGDRLFLTTAIPTGSAAAAPPAEAGGRGPGGGAGAGQEHRFEVLAVDRKTGKILWQRTATTAVPHEGYHRIYGSFASNAPATDGQRVYAFFGSRGLYVYDLEGKPLWQKDFGLKMAMRLAFGEGTGAVVHNGTGVPAVRSPAGRLHRRARWGDRQRAVARTPHGEFELVHAAALSSTPVRNNWS